MPSHSDNAVNSVLAGLGSVWVSDSSDPSAQTGARGLVAVVDQHNLDIERATIAISRTELDPHRTVPWYLIRIRASDVTGSKSIIVGGTEDNETAPLAPTTTALIGGVPRMHVDFMGDPVLIEVGSFVVGERSPIDLRKVEIPKDVLGFACVTNDSAVPTFAVPLGAGVELDGNQLTFSRPIPEWAKVEGDFFVFWLRNARTNDHLLSATHGRVVRVPELLSPDSTWNAVNSVWDARINAPAIGPTLRGMASLVDAPVAADSTPIERVVVAEGETFVVGQTATYAYADEREPSNTIEQDNPITGVEVVQGVPAWAAAVLLGTTHGEVAVDTSVQSPTVIDTAAGPRLRFGVSGSPAAVRAFWESADSILTQDAVSGIAIPTGSALVTHGPTLPVSPGADLVPLMIGRPITTLVLTGRPTPHVDITPILDAFDIGFGTFIISAASVDPEDVVDVAQPPVAAVHYADAAAALGPADLGDFVSLFPRA